MKARTLVGLVLGIFLATSLVYVKFGKIHVDEAFYIYSAHLVFRGKLLYRDFFYLQNPAQPYVYGLALQAVASPYAARFVSVAFSLAGLFACMGLARLLSGTSGAAIAAVLLGLNSFQTYYDTIVRIYAPAAALLVIGGYLYRRVAKPAPAALAAGICFGLSFDFRLTMAPAILLMVLLLLARRRRREAAAAAGGFVLAVIPAFLPFLLAAPGKLWFQLVGFHEAIRVEGGIPVLLLFKVRHLPALVSAYFLLVLGLLIVAFCFRKATADRSLVALVLAGDNREAVLWLVVGGTFFGHFVPMFVQVSYFVVAIPLLAALVGGVLGRLLPEAFQHRLLAFVFAAGLIQMLAYGKTSLDIDRQIEGPFDRMAPYAAYLKEATRPGDLVLSSDSQLAPFLAGREILHGYETFEFFPFWSREKCERYGVVNTEMIVEQIERGDAAAVLINRLSYRKPFPVSVDFGPEDHDRIVAALKKRYRKTATFPNPFLEGIESEVYLRDDREAPSPLRR